VRVFSVAIALLGLFVVTQRSFIAEQVATVATNTQSPTAPAEWQVEAGTLLAAAEAGRGTHSSEGAIHHTVDYPYQLLAALENPTYSVEANVTVIDGVGFLQHDPLVPVGMPLLDFLRYSAIADFPIVKLDLKRDLVGPVIAEVQQAVERFELEPDQVHFNANVFRGPGVEDDLVGARSDKSFVHRMYNLIVMELETSDLIETAEHFPESTVVISSTTATGPLDESYTLEHLEQFAEAAAEIREASPGQPLVFAVRGDLAARSDPDFFAGLHAIEDSYIAAWWSAEAPSTDEEISILRSHGVGFFDLGQEQGR
jgi:hypothetical protein